LTIDSLRAVRLVTADGRIVRASATENEDLFWALRGGGGNFGVVTQFEFDLHPVGPEVFAGMVVHPIADAASVIEAYQAVVEQLPDELTCWAVLRKAPPLPFLPEAWHGREVLLLPMCYVGDVSDGEDATRAIRSIGNPIVEAVGPVAFTDWQTSFDPLLTPGARNYWKSHDMATFDGAAIEKIVAAVGQLPTDECEIFFGHVGGQATRVGENETAWPNRAPHYAVNVHTRWQSPSDDDRCVAWARALYDALAPHAMGTRYINFIPEGDENQGVQSLYGDNFERLMAVKATWDPANLFRTNINLAANS